MKRTLFAVTAIALVVIFVLAAWWYRDQRAERLGFMAQEQAELFVRPHSPVLGAEDGGMGAHEQLGLLLGHEAEALGPLVPVPPGGQDEDDDEGDGGDGEQGTFHERVLRWTASKRPITAVKARRDSRGMESRPKNSMYSSVQEIPWAQGCRPSGTTPA